MFLLDFYLWWYSQGWASRARAYRKGLSLWYDFFSFSILLRTLFAPWRQTVSQTGQHSSLQRWFSTLVDNTISRLVGGVVRGGLLLFGGIVYALLVAIGLVGLIVWPVLPVLPLVIAVVGVGL